MTALPAADYETHSPRYLQVYMIVKDWIQNGRYAPNERLPSEGELCTMLGVSRITTRRAIEMLAGEGLVRRVQGVGTFVPAAVPKRVEPLGSVADLAGRVSRLAERTRLVDIGIEEKPAGAIVANELQLGDEGEPVIHARYTRVEKRLPIGMADLYLPAALGISLSEADLRANSGPDMLRAKGVAISGAHQVIGAVLADATLAQRLKVNLGAPLVRIRLLILGADQAPVEFLDAYYRADAYEHHAFLASV